MRPLAYNVLLARACSSLTAGLMLSQALYWTEITKDEDGWFFKTQKEWTDETYLTRFEQESARKQLRKLKLVEEKRAGKDRKIYFRVNLRAVIVALKRVRPQANMFSESEVGYAENQQTKTDLGLLKSSSPVCGKVAVGSAGFQHSGLLKSSSPYKEAETTTETTAESTSGRDLLTFEEPLPNPTPPPRSEPPPASRPPEPAHPPAVELRRLSVDTAKRMRISDSEAAFAIEQRLRFDHECTGLGYDQIADKIVLGLQNCRASPGYNAGMRFKNWIADGKYLDFLEGPNGKTQERQPERVSPMREREQRSNAAIDRAFFRIVEGRYGTAAATAALAAASAQSEAPHGNHGRHSRDAPARMGNAGGEVRPAVVIRRAD